MKAPTPDGFLIDVEAPVLPAFEVIRRALQLLRDGREHMANEIARQYGLQESED